MTKILMTIGLFTVAAIISPWLALGIAVWLVWKIRGTYRH